MCQISSHVKEAVRGLGKIKQIEVEKADGGFISTTRHEGHYEGKRAVHPHLEALTKHLKKSFGSK